MAEPLAPDQAEAVAAIMAHSGHGTARLADAGQLALPALVGEQAEQKAETSRMRSAWRASISFVVRDRGGDAVKELYRAVGQAILYNAGKVILSRGEVK